jgi:hypothetical protein
MPTKPKTEDMVFNISGVEDCILDEEFPMVTFDPKYHKDCHGLVDDGGDFSGQIIYRCEKCRKEWFVDEVESIRNMYKSLYLKIELTVNLQHLEPVAKMMWVNTDGKCFMKTTELQGLELAKYYYPENKFKIEPYIDNLPF